MKNRGIYNVSQKGFRIDVKGKDNNGYLWYELVQLEVEENLNVYEKSKVRFFVPNSFSELVVLIDKCEERKVILKFEEIAKNWQVNKLIFVVKDSQFVKDTLAVRGYEKRIGKNFEELYIKDVREIKKEKRRIIDDEAS